MRDVEPVVLQRHKHPYFFAYRPYYIWQALNIRVPGLTNGYLEVARRKKIHASHFAERLCQIVGLCFMYKPSFLDLRHWSLRRLAVSTKSQQLSNMQHLNLGLGGCGARLCAPFRFGLEFPRFLLITASV